MISMHNKERDNDILEKMLDEAIDKCFSGRTIDDVLNDYDNSYSAELRSLLEVACGFHSLEKPQISGKALFKSLTHLDVEKEHQKIKFPRLISRLAASFAIIGFMMFGLNVFAVNSLPGDGLYFVKRLSEQIEYMITPTADGKVELKLTFSRKRMTELLAQNNSGAAVELELVHEMLREATISLTHLKAVSSEKRGVLMSQVRDINRRHIETLNHIGSDKSSDVQAALKAIAITCDCREKWFGQLYESIQGDDCQPGSCCCAPSETAFNENIEMFPHY